MGTKERKIREKLQRKNTILAAAKELFWANGYDHTTMPQIAEKTEFALGTLYLYFPSKDALYTALLLEGYDVLLEALKTARDANRRKALRKQFDALLNAFFAFARAYPEYFDIIFFVLQKEGARQEFLTPAELQNLWAKEQECKDIAIDILMKSGHSGTDVDITINAVWSMLVGVYFYFKRLGPEELEPVAADAQKLILDALFSD
jgi:AcrR family transcriptional regulator